MKKLKITALLLALLMLATAFVSCAGDDGDAAESDTTATSDTTADDKKDDKKEEIAGETTITVTDAKGSAGLVGDVTKAFVDDADAENVITGAAGNPIWYSISAALPSPTQLTALVLKAPSKDTKHLASATIDASVDGETWVTIKELGNSIIKDKVYNLAVKDETAYSYIRVRQADDKRLEDFRFRSMVIKGVPQEGAAGDIAKVADEAYPAKLLALSNPVPTNAGTGDVANVFADNANSWTADARTEGKPNYVIASLAKKTEIFKVVVKLSGSNNSTEGSVVQASTNGQVWVDLYTIPANEAETAEFVAEVNDQELYSHIRVIQKAENATSKWTLNSVLVYGVESADAADELLEKFVAADTLKVVYNASLSNVKPNTDTDDPASVWDVLNKASTYTNAINKEKEGGHTRIAGTFKYGTVITKLLYHCPPNYGTRIRTSLIEASVDGETWVKLAQFQGNYNQDEYNAGNVMEFNINAEDNTLYKYIRIVHADSFHDWNLTVGTLEVIGIQYDENGKLILDGGVTIVTGTKQKVNYHSSSDTLHSGNAADVFGDDTTKNVTFKPSDEQEFVMGSFTAPTQVTKITYHVVTQTPGRARNSAIQLSVDGITWKTIGSILNAADPATQVFTVTDETKYSYIRVIQHEDDVHNTEYSQYGVIEVEGVI